LRAAIRPEEFFGFRAKTKSYLRGAAPRAAGLKSNGAGSAAPDAWPKPATRPAQPGRARFQAALLPPDFASRSGKHARRAFRADLKDIAHRYVTGYDTARPE